MADALKELAPGTLSLEIIEIGSLPLYNQDLDENPPQAWRDFRSRLLRCDGVLFVTPEYNRSVPCVLKNAIDVGSRPYGKGVFAGKPAAVVTQSTGGTGGFGCNHHLRQSLVHLDAHVLAQPEMYVGNLSAAKFGEDGRITDPGLAKLIDGFASKFADWVDRLVD